MNLTMAPAGDLQYACAMHTMLAPMHALLNTVPYIALFASIAIGVWIGKPSFKGVSLGAVAGTLVAAVAIGQWHFSIPGPFQDIMFALFIFSIGYVAGPSFVHAFSKKAWRLIVQATFIAGVALATVLVLADIYKLDLGTAAGLASGAVTQSAIIGTAGGAIQSLNLPAATKAALESNVAIAYSITYLFGTLGAILLITYVGPLISRQTLVAGAKEIEDRDSGGKVKLSEGEVRELPARVSRAYTVAAGAKQHVSALERAIGPDVAIVRVMRLKVVVDITADPILLAGDQVLVIGNSNALLKGAEGDIGPEISSMTGEAALGESLNVVLTNGKLNHKPFADIGKTLPAGSVHGVHLAGITRTALPVELLARTELRTGDTLHLVGLAENTERLGKQLGYIEKAPKATDLIWLSLGIIVGILIGLVHVPIGAGVKISLGTGGGCMFSGLLFGYLRSLHPTFGQLPSPTADFLKNFGLIAFIAVVGLTAGPKAFATIQQQGLTLLYLGAIVTIVPIVAAQLLGAYVLRGDLKNSQLLAGSIAGGRSCTAALGSVMTVSGSNAAMLTYPVTYTLAQALLTLFGPLIVGIMSSWGAWAVLIHK